MWAMSSQFLAAVRTSHRLAMRAEWYMDGAWEGIPLTDGSVSADYYSLVLRTFDVTLSPSVSSIEDRDRLDTFGPSLYGTYVRIHRGVEFPNGEIEMAPVGVFVIEHFTRVTGGDYGLTFGGADLYSMLNRARMEIPRSVSGPSRVEVCKSLIREALEPSLPWGPVVFRVLPGVVDDDLRSTLVERDRGTAIRDILGGAGIRGYFAADGAFEFAPEVSEAKTSVWTLSTGDDGTLIESKEALERERIYNCVVVTGESTDQDVPPVYGIARDMNENSPTFYEGPFGKVPYFYTSQFIYTEEQALAVANSLLPTVRGPATAYDVSTIPNPALVPGDAVSINLGTGALDETHMITSMSIPLTPGGAMSMETQLLKAATTRRRATWPRL